MCGICGQYNFRSGKPVSPSAIRLMTNTMVHRGPDDEGYYINGPVGLGFRRLSIIDLESGRQPMSNEDGSVYIVFNGEIYNFHELRHELEGKGHVFATRSDTEVIVHGYEEWGDKVLDRLNGMFGLAIWEERRKRLLLARDPMGIKPVYYRIHNGSLWFGSEMRPILAAMEGKPEVDPLSVNLFLRYRYTPAPLTIVKGVMKLAAGTKLVVHNGACNLTRWYNFAPRPFDPPKSIDEAQEELLEIYKRAVKRQLISDVPLGLLLSGGIDSGLLLALMNLYGKEWPTFSIGYGDTFKDDELRDAAETAKIFSARHTGIQIERRTFEEALPGVLGCLEEPVASSSIVPMYFVSQRAREDVKVALIGQGPDELFGGYIRHLGVRYGFYWRILPKWVREGAAAIVKNMPRHESWKRGIYSLAVSNRMKRFQYVFSIAPGEVVDSLFQDDILPSNPGDKVLELWGDIEPSMAYLDDLGAFQILELRSSLPDELLMYADKLSMAHSLEVRVPYLDKEVVEYVQRIPSNYKVHKWSRKWLHKKVCEVLLPKEIIKRRKRGFAVNVVDKWFRESLDSRMNQVLVDPDSVIFNVLRRNRVLTLLEQHRRGKEDNHKLLFSVVNLELWMRHQDSGVCFR
jgi:asparagine synthase (glutamine-hydrolysing)